MNIENDFDIKDLVYLIHDIDQKPRMVTAIVIQESGILYELICANEISNHYGWEMTKDKKY